MNEFFKAIKERNEELIYALLEQGADPNCEFEGKMCLRYLIGEPKLVRLLMDYGAQPWVKDQEERSLLVEAVYKDDIHTVGYLLACDAHSMYVNEPDEEGHTPLGCATYCGRNEDMIRYLLFCQANTNQFDNARETFPFIEVARGFKRDMLELFIEYGANPFITDKKGDTALIVAVWPGSDENIAFLLRLKIPVNRQNNCGETALHKAAEIGAVSLIKLLLEAGADPSIKDNESSTPLMRLLAQEDSASEVKEQCEQLLKMYLKERVV